MLPNVNGVNRFLFSAGGTLPIPAPIGEGQCNTFDDVTNSFGPVVSTLDENNLAWRVVLDWSPNENTLVYASVSRGYKSGTSPVNAASKARQNAPVVQERLTAYELGLKATPARSEQRRVGKGCCNQCRFRLYQLH